MSQMTAKVKIGDKMNVIAWKLGIISYSNRITTAAYNVSADIIGNAAKLVNKEYKLGEIRAEVKAKWVALGIKEITPSLTYQSGEAGKFFQKFVCQSVTSPFKNALNKLRGVSIILNEEKQEELRKTNEYLMTCIQKTFSLNKDDRDEV